MFPTFFMPSMMHAEHEYGAYINDAGGCALPAVSVPATGICPDPVEFHRTEIK
jgi:hypothetical protein